MQKKRLHGGSCWENDKSTLSRFGKTGGEPRARHPLTVRLKAGQTQRYPDSFLSTQVDFHRFTAAPWALRGSVHL